MEADLGVVDVTAVAQQVEPAYGRRHGAVTESGLHQESYEQATVCPRLLGFFRSFDQ